jgi:hypothetical protein
MSPAEDAAISNTTFNPENGREIPPTVTTMASAPAAKVIPLFRSSTSGEA